MDMEFTDFQTVYVIKDIIPKAKNPEKEYFITATNQWLMRDHSRTTYPTEKGMFLTATERNNQRLG